jgi:diaminopimelate decarboxylase
MFNVESVPELKRINFIAKRQGQKVKAALRINPDIIPGTHAYITTGKKETKFGIDTESAKKIFLEQKIFPNIELAGIHIHIGSQITRVAPFVRAVKKMYVFLEFLKERNIKINYLNIGGGLGIQYSNERVESIKEFASKLSPLLKATGLKIILEPGRFITGNSGILVAKVIYVKDSPVKRFIILDGAMNDFIRPSLYEAFHMIVPVEKKAPINSLRVRASDVVGPVCETGDFFGKNRKLAVEESEYVAIMGAGAYGQSMASNYNSRLRPAEVLVKTNRVSLIRKRETYQDLVKKEILI